MPPRISRARVGKIPSGCLGEMAGLLLVNMEWARTSPSLGEGAE